jgi:hypothetical protein
VNCILVGRTGSGESVYFVVDENTPKEETGLVVTKTGKKYLVPFWTWVGSARGLEQLQENEFQQALWSQNEEEDDGAWVDIFVNRKVPFSKEMLGDTPIQTIQVGAPKPKNSSGAMEMQTKVAILMMQMNERP